MKLLEVGLLKADPSPVVGGDSLRGHVIHDGCNERCFADDGGGERLVESKRHISEVMRKKVRTA